MKILTERLQLRNLRDADAEDFLAYRSDPEVCRFQGYEPYTREQAAQHLDRLKDGAFGERAGEWAQVGIELVAENKIIGDIGLKPEAASPRVVEFGVSMSRQFQKHGYASEALTAIFDFLFETKNIHRIIGIVDVENADVIRLLERLKFRREAAFVESYWDGKMWRDEFLYATLAKDWTNRK